jgi:8-oxo-dGTP diphosphatase
MLNVVCALIIKDDTILAAQLGDQTSHPFKWEFPGGKIKPGETSEEAIKREIYEELNLQVDVRKKLQPINYQYKTKKINLIPFICTIIKGQFKLIEHNDFGWYTINELLKLDLAEADRKLIELTLNQQLLLSYIRKNLN